ncbi:MAG: TonB-dependent receptor plug domain-containing protein [Paracoccaceae bacterium]
MLKLPKIFRFLIPVSAAFLVLPGMATVAQAQAGADEIEEIITTGTRRAARTASDSTIPIDVITGAEFENMGTGDIDEMLRTTLPSYNVQRFAISDAATLVRPATMRGLPPDNVLILVNGKRRWRSGVISEGGALTTGAQGPDIASIPAMAIKQVEVLRDGASAQYGSDAIAGVMNFVLRDASDGLTVEEKFGEYSEGDGASTQIAANAGFALGDDGFANITVQWRESDPTSRSIQRTDAATLIRSGSPSQQANVRQPYAQIWGAPETRDDINVFLNAAIAVSDSQEVYAFGNYGTRETEGGFYFRNPNNRGAVYTANGFRAIVDTNITPGMQGVTSNCPALVPPGSGSNGVDLDPAAVQADALELANLPPNCWVMNIEAPGGYTPQFGGTLIDAGGVVGIRGEMNNGLLYDFSGGYGRNEVEFFLNNTWNPSYGPDTSLQGGSVKRDFDIGSNAQTETNLNADFVLPIAVDAFASDLNFAFGAEWRNERFETRIGEVQSWNAGDYAFQNVFGNVPNTYSDGITPLPNLSIGAHGFAGFGPQQAGVWDRANYAVYGDLEADVTDNFTVGAAVRFEDFDDFGTTTNYKVSARWGITDAFAVRGSFSTGFRAPTPGQSNVTKISTITVNGELQQRGQIPPTNPIAQFLGGEQLKPEDATNFTAGVVWDMTDTLNFTLDFFNIELTDRITQTGTINIAGEPVPPGVDCPTSTNLAECLQELGVPGAADLSSISFYTNDFDTTTQGFEFVGTWATDFGAAGNGSLVAAWSYTETTVDRIGTEVSRDRVADLENFNPLNRGIFTYNHFIGDFRFLARASFYDSWTVADFAGDPDFTPAQTGYTLDCAFTPNTGPSGGVNVNDKCYDSEWIFDLEAAYTFADKYSFIVGLQNAGDSRGPLDASHLDNTIGSGNRPDTGTPYDWGGSFWYFRLRADF